jgi:hypothetical protein
MDVGVGVMNTPKTAYALNGWPWAADNGCFSAAWKADEWLTWLRRQRRDALFAVVPDVVGDHHSTRQRWDEWGAIVDNLGFRPLYVLQDGQPIDDVPWDECGGVFVGGSTDYKLSYEARRIVERANDSGLYTHMGRVNSLKRLRIARDWGCDSVDGTFLAFGPATNVPRMLRWFDALDLTGRVNTECPSP